ALAAEGIEFDREASHKITVEHRTLKILYIILARTPSGIDVLVQQVIGQHLEGGLLLEDLPTQAHVPKDRIPSEPCSPSAVVSRGELIAPNQVFVPIGSQLYGEVMGEVFHVLLIVQSVPCRIDSQGILAFNFQ